MIDMRVNKDTLQIREVSFKDYKQLKVELMILVFQVIAMYNLETESKEDINMLHFILDIQDYLTSFENEIKTHKGELYESYIEFKKEYQERKRGVKNGNGKQDNSI